MPQMYIPTFPSCIGRNSSRMSRSASNILSDILLLPSSILLRTASRQRPPAKDRDQVLEADADRAGRHRHQAGGGHARNGVDLQTDRGTRRGKPEINSRQVTATEGVIG